MKKLLGCHVLSMPLLRLGTFQNFSENCNCFIASGIGVVGIFVEDNTHFLHKNLSKLATQQVLIGWGKTVSFSRGPPTLFLSLRCNLRLTLQGLIWKRWATFKKFLLQHWKIVTRAKITRLSERQHLTCRMANKYPNWSQDFCLCARKQCTHPFLAERI